MTEPAEAKDEPSSFLFVPPVQGQAPLYRFGDIIEAPWLVAPYLRDDTRRIQITGPDKNGGDRFVLMPIGEPLPERETANLVLAHVEDIAVHGLTRRGMILTDDCEIANRQRENRGRIRIAAVGDLPTEPRQLEDLLTHADVFDRFVVARDQDPSGQGFRIDFPMTASLAAPDLAKTTVALRPANEDVRQALLRRWCAQAARHGPDVTGDGLDKLAKLIQANGDAAEVRRLTPKTSEPRQGLREALDPLRKVLLHAWTIEGPVLDRIARDLEDGRPPQEVARELLRLIDALAAAAHEARDSISAIVPPEPPRS